MQPNGIAIGDTICRTAELGVTITGAEPVEPHVRAAKKTMNKRRKDIFANIRHKINAL
ncbi:hypothetical protein FRC0508_00255 [Corynebacterium diphtheriae]|nr:hypothetical protein FRC0050_00206 [Corynebacterium diphtheriae]CAB0675935.1 hypothetical protein FRC0049_00206 [Corynebacterium diphtheriae]CAB0892705.1 hypothetical protein FRC0402_02302 [Corynebacterium diphtheriae]CAB0982270.1 hypothetical protein FRC0508_00255 [Corynebacterium diphtheriae]